LPTAAAPQRTAETAPATVEAALNAQRTAGQARAMHSVARQGLGDPAGPYPHGARIRAAFGAYAPSGLSAHMGPAARAASGALSAGGYVLNGRAVFAERPSLHTAAHEAAHMVHQAHGGAALAHGVGHMSDAHERLADRVADTVATGGSAEPLFASMFGGASPSTPAGPMLQMVNRIASETATLDKTPWKEINDQLKLKSSYDIDATVSNISNRFAMMVSTLGNRCERAATVTADLDGNRQGGPRKSDNTQTAYGALGSFEEFLTGTQEVKKYEFEGGHLVSDEILGDASYVQANFAPQRGHFNSPIYRKIEEIAAFGVMPVKPTKKKSPNWTMKAQVHYPAVTHKVPTAKIQKRLSIQDKDIGKKPKPKTVTLTTRVPSRWTATAEVADKDFVFRHESSLDSTDGASAGFLKSEKLVEGKEKDTDQFLDANYWSMDSLQNASQSKIGALGTKASSKHTFTAVQSVPRGQKAVLGTGTVALPKPKAVTAPVLKKTYPMSRIINATDKDLTELARKIMKQNVGLQTNQTALGRAFRALREGSYKRARGSRFSRVDFMKLDKVTKKRRKRDTTVKRPRKVVTKVIPKISPAQMKDSLARLIVLQRFDNSDNAMDFSA
jgi:hypothetical protein